MFVFSKRKQTYRHSLICETKSKSHLIQLFEAVEYAQAVMAWAEPVTAHSITFGPTAEHTYTSFDEALLYASFIVDDIATPWAFLVVVVGFL